MQGLARTGRKETYREFWWKARRKEPLGRPRSRSEYNIKMDLREIGWGDIDWINLAQDRDQSQALVNTIINYGLP
jgi:hypothetical protein